MATDATPTPAEREARIAELRDRRRARLRKLAIRSAIGTGVVVALLALGAYWALMTLGGRAFVLAQVVARLPSGTELTWRDAEGPAAGPLVLHGVRFVMRTCPDRDGEPVAYGDCAMPRVLTFTARRILLDPDIRPLFGRLLRLDALEIQQATLDLPADNEPFELPRWPEVLPRIEPPLGLQADTIRIDGLDVTTAGAPTIAIRSVRGGLDARAGKLGLARVVIDSDRGVFRVDGDYAPRDNFAIDLTASALFPAPAGRTRARLGLAARGDLAAMELALRGNAPAPVRADLVLRGGERPTWTLRAASDGLDPGAFTGQAPVDAPLSFDLSAKGVGGAADVRGRFARGDLVAVLQPSTLHLEDEVLEVSPLVVDVFGGRVVVRGRGDFADPGNADFRFGVDARGLSFASGDTGGNDDAVPIGADARFGIAGTTRAWAAIGKATLRRDSERAVLDFDGRGDADALRLRKLHVAMPTGTLDATGQAGWAPALHWDIDARLAGFDPGYFASGWNGAVNGRLSSTGSTRADGGLDARVVAERLGGSLRGRPLDGQASFAMRGPATGRTRTDYEGELALGLGASRITARGRVADTLDIDARVAPLQLADLLPGAAGLLRGTLALTGTREAPNLAADLAGTGLRYRTNAADTLRIDGRLPWAAGSAGSLVVEARGLEAGVALDSLRIDARGAIEDLRLEARARGDIGALDLAASVQRPGNGLWRGTLASLQLAPAKGATWRLQSPTRFAQTGNGFTLSQGCFSSGAGSLCASADWPRRGMVVDGRNLPLALVEPYLPRRDDGRPWRLNGEVSLDADLRPAGSAYAGSAHVVSPAGGVRVGDRARRDVVGYRDLVLDAEFEAGRIRATLGAALAGGGRVAARLETGWDAYAPLSGSVAVDTDELTWLELFSPDIVDPKGRLDAGVTLAGTRAQPSLGGQAHLAAFTTEIPSLGIVLQQGDVRLDARPDGSARITGSVRSGEGTLAIDGSLGWRADAAGNAPPLVLAVRGTDVLVSDTRDLRATASPELEVRFGGGQPLTVSGTVRVPEARIDLERLDRGVSASPDVVVLDPADPDDTASPIALALDLTLVMGDDVQLQGFGLDGTLDGRLRVRSQPGREMTALGLLNVGGTYAAYGQELSITRGRLQWSNGPVSDPILDIRAEREIEARGVTAGIDVGGRASSPQATVWSDPASSQSDALAYLTLGRPTSNLTGAEGQQINAASAALNAGGNLLASRLGSRIGLDDAGINDSRALGGSVLGIGKQLSPRLYVGFGVSLLGTGQVLTLKYLLAKGFDVEIESSTLENRGSLNWRKEK